MSLSKKQMDKVGDWLKARKVDTTPCGVCGHVGMEVAPKLLACPMAETRGKVSKEHGMYFVPVACAGCGYTRFFFAETIGVNPS